MFSAISRWLIKNRLRAQERNDQKSFLDWERVDSIALIVATTEGLNRNALDKWIGDTKKFIEVFYIEPKNKNATFGDWNCFTKKDKTIFNLPKKTIETQLNQKTYNLVINTALPDNYFATAVFNALQAPFKCAPSTELQDANLIVRPSVEGNLIHQLQDTLRYLQMIKT